MAAGGRLGSSAAGLRALSVCIGTFVLFMGISKIDWFADPGILSGLFQEWLDSGTPASRWYLERIAIPGTPLFARVIPCAEMIIGLALICGFQIRIAAAVMLLMVLNFHFASNVLLHYSYLINGYGLPVLGSLLALAVGGGKLPLTVSR